MAIRVTLSHKTFYRFDRPTQIFPHEIRLRPAAHCRTPVSGYALHVAPGHHFVNWQQDGYGNWVARLVFPEPANALEIEVGLVAEMTVINPFDFFIEPYAEHFPFAYPEPLAGELAPFLETLPPGPLLERYVQSLKQGVSATPPLTIDFLVAMNRRLQQDIRYNIRLAPGVQTPEETLSQRLGSCRDSAWLLVQVARHLGLAARFVSGYLIQLVADQRPLEGPCGPAEDFTDLHAWAEIYLPGAGWLGLDPTSGLLAGEGHLPLACTASPQSAAPVTGATGPCEVTFGFAMTVTRIDEAPRVTKPYTEAQWTAIDALGQQVDQELAANGVRMTMGGEPTFVAVDHLESQEWHTQALGPHKRQLAGLLFQRLAAHWAAGGVRHHGQGKWYPGEPLPRWALNLFWRTDGQPLWHNPQLLAHDDPEVAAKPEAAQRFAAALATRLGIVPARVIAAFEDPLQFLKEEAALPANLDLSRAALHDDLERARLVRLLASDLQQPAGAVIPLQPAPRLDPRQPTTWMTGPWLLRRPHLYLLPGDSPLGLRLPLASLPVMEAPPAPLPADPFAAQAALPGATKPRAAKPRTAIEVAGITTALCVEVRSGLLHVFLPPLEILEDFVALLQAIEETAAALNMPVRLEGYGPPQDLRLRKLSVTPDPGVIEVNMHPAAHWPELVDTVTGLYEAARQSRLCTEKFMLDGRHTGTGGGNHVTLGGVTVADSPLLRRPDLLRSLITFWQNHPALSYLFSGQFVGPTSQSPRVDEARDDNLYELELAFRQMDRRLASGTESSGPWLVDRLLRNLLVDLTGNTHRAEFSIDKLYSPDGPTGRLGLLEFRAFEMPPHARMSLAQLLLLRALVAWFWRQPYTEKLVRWGTELHDRFMLPHAVEQDLEDVLARLNRAGYPFDAAWFAPFIEFRFPRYGSVTHDGVTLELRQAIEPWHVLGEAMNGGATARYVDSSVERLQLKVTGMVGERHQVQCNGMTVPLHPTGVRGEFVAGIRFKAWNPPSSQHPTIGVHSPLIFDLVDGWNLRSLGGCTYHVTHPGGRNYDTFPVNAQEAEARRFARFWPHGHTPGPIRMEPAMRNPDFPMTLDLRLWG